MFEPGFDLNITNIDRSTSLFLMLQLDAIEEIVDALMLDGERETVPRPM